MHRGPKPDLPETLFKNGEHYERALVLHEKLERLGDPQLAKAFWDLVRAAHHNDPKAAERALARLHEKILDAGGAYVPELLHEMAECCQHVRDPRAALFLRGRLLKLTAVLIENAPDGPAPASSADEIQIKAAVEDLPTHSPTAFLEEIPLRLRRDDGKSHWEALTEACREMGDRRRAAQLAHAAEEPDEHERSHKAKETVLLIAALVGEQALHTQAVREYLARTEQPIFQAPFEELAKAELLRSVQGELSENRAREHRRHTVR